MGRIRTIKPEFYTDEDLSTLPVETHLMAGGLLTYADDEGFFNANAGLIKAALSPLREPSLSIPEILRRLQEIGYLQLGNTPDGKTWGRIVNFSTHQRVSHPTPSKISKLQVSWDIPENSGNSPEASVNTPESFRPERKGKEGKEGKDQPFNPTEASGYCMTEWCLSGMENRRIVIEAIGRVKDKSPMESAVWLVEERLAYEQSVLYRDAEARFRKGIVKWLSDGTWSNWRGSPKKEKPFEDGWQKETRELKERQARDRANGTLLH